MDSVITNIRSASREIVKHTGVIRNLFQSIGSISLCYALIELDTWGEMNVAKLAQLLALDQSTTSRLVDQMVQEGMCKTRVDENDRRNKLVALTTKGLDLTHSMNNEASTHVQHALNTMSDEDKKLVSQGMLLYAKALRRASLLQEYTIRNLQPKDVPELIRLTKTIWIEFGFDSLHPDAAHFEAELDQLYETYSTNKCCCYVLIHRNKLVGRCGFGPLEGEDDSICELKGTYLAASTRGLGLGALLLSHTLQAAKQEGFKECYLETMDFMHAANSLYQKSGFIKLNKPMGNTGHKWTTCWYLKKL